MVFQQLGRREVIGQFDGGMISSDAGGLVLREVERCFGILKRFAGCFRDYRDPQRTEHSLKSLIRQRVYGIALGYEDLSDHDRLRHDVVMGVLCEKSDPTGAGRARKRDRGKAIGGKSTLNRLELTPKDANEKSRYKKIVANGDQIDDLMVEVYIEAQPIAPEEVVLEIDATDDIVYGKQEGRFFHGYYGDYCYLPLYAFVGDIPLWAQLRTSDQDGAAGVVPALEAIVRAIRKRCKRARIIVRADSGFCREQLLAWCERQVPVVYYCVGLQKNSALIERLATALAQARARRCLTAAPTSTCCATRATAPICSAIGCASARPLRSSARSNGLLPSRRTSSESEIVGVSSRDLRRISQSSMRGRSTLPSVRGWSTTCPAAEGGL